MAYLASPIDLVPDFLPVIGVLDDAIVVALTLRWIVRVAGPERVRRPLARVAARAGARAAGGLQARRVTHDVAGRRAVAACQRVPLSLRPVVSKRRPLTTM